MTHTLCESPDCARPIATGFGLCADCERKVRQELRTLPELYSDCEERLIRTPQGLVERIRRTRPRGTSLNEAAMSVRTDILDILSSWCKLVAYDRDIPAPGTRDAKELADYLDGHVNWLARHAAAGDFVAEVRDLVKTARGVAENTGGDPRQLGHCDRDGCGRMVYVTNLDSGGHKVRCTAGHVWAARDWMALSQRMRQDERVA